MKYKRTYETSEYHCAIALVASGYEIISIDKTDPRRCFFEFRDTEALRETIRKFWLRQLKLNVNAVLESESYVKALIHNDDV